jgi:GMP synthase (glutamine-hydrolysing)
MSDLAAADPPAAPLGPPDAARPLAGIGEPDGAAPVVAAAIAAAEVVVLDYGGQYSQLIARRVRECGVFSELLPHDIGAEAVARRQPRGLILSGGPASVYAPGAPRLDPELLELGIPVLGICYGMQLLVHELGGRVELAEVGEFGRSDLRVLGGGGRLLTGLPVEQTCWMSHRDAVYTAPAGFTALASSSGSPVAAVEDTERDIYGIQFHPEVIHTPYGQEILTTFLADVCGCSRDWTAASIVEDQIARIRAQVGDAAVICGLSGGVDSSVAALLVHRAVGDQLTCVFVDHGLMRKGEGEQVIAAFRDHFKVPLVAVDAEERFLEKLVGVSDPETKRKLIGREFIRVFEEEAEKISSRLPARFLVQGTLYSDVIESGGGTGSATIKSHHNVGGLPDDLQFELVEPLRALFKDEVRAVGAELGLPERLVWRQPFPGPGLAIRIVGGEATKERLDLLRDADYILQDEIRRAGLYRELWQSFAVLPAVRSVGVMGDERTYAYPIVIRAVTSDDAMTADWARLPYDLLERISSRLINEVPGVNRVAYDITSKPPGTIEWE